jgi:hypothetical protein
LPSAASISSAIDLPFCLSTIIVSANFEAELHMVRQSASSACASHVACNAKIAITTQSFLIATWFSLLSANAANNRLAEERSDETCPS